MTSYENKALFYYRPQIPGLCARQPRTVTREAEPANVEPVAPRQHRGPDGRALEV